MVGRKVIQNAPIIPDTLKTPSHLRSAMERF
jgi:hypothetical protein